MTEYEVEELKAEVLDLIMTMTYWPGNNDEKFWDVQTNTWELLKRLKPSISDNEYEELYDMYEQAIMWG